MKKRGITIKQTIKKKIELRNNELVFRKRDENMNEKDRLRIYGSNRPSASEINVKNLSNVERTKLRAGIGNESAIISVSDSYNLKVFVDYDVVICIPSHERYDKLKRIIEQLYSQPTIFTFKLIVLNDGSIDRSYDGLSSEFPDIIYLKNNVPNGIGLHWYCYTQLWEKVRNIQCHALLQMDDDFILSNGFLNRLLTTYFKIKAIDNKIMAIAPHSWSFQKVCGDLRFDKEIIDGIGLFDIEFIKSLDYKFPKIDFTVIGKGTSAGVWAEIGRILKNNGCYVHRTEKSLVWHDGNEDSKLHGDFRRKKAIYTQNYIDNNLSYD